MYTREELQKQLSNLSREELLEIAITALLERENERVMRATEQNLYKNVQQNATETLRKYNELEALTKAQTLVIVGLLYVYQKTLRKYENLMKLYEEATAQILALQSANASYLKEIFGPSSEQLDRLLNLNLADLEDEDEDEDEKDEENADQEAEKLKNLSESAWRRRILNGDKPRRKKRRGRSRENLLKLLVRTLYDTKALEEADKKYGAGNWELVGWEETNSVEFIPALVLCLRILRPVFRYRTLDPRYRSVFDIDHVPRKATAINRSHLSESLIAAILADCYSSYQPLYRQAHDPNRFGGYEISTQRMSHWVLKIAARLEPLYDHFIKLLLQRPYIQSDETYWNVIHDLGVKNVFWVYRTGELLPGPSITVVSYSTGHGVEHIKELFAKASLCKYHLTVDAGTVYEAVQKLYSELVVLCLCWAHARRRFFDAAALRKKDGITEEQLAKLDETIILKIIAKIYSIDDKLKPLSAEERLAQRNLKIRPLVDKFFNLLKGYDLTAPQLTEKFKSAIQYALNHETGLRMFLEDGNIPIDNNATERDIKNIALLRNNSLFSNTVKGANASAILMSFSITAKASGANPYYYFLYLVRHSLEIQSRRANLDDMLPWSEAYKNFEKEEPQRLMKLLIPPGYSETCPETPKIVPLRKLLKAQ